MMRRYLKVLLASIVFVAATPLAAMADDRSVFGASLDPGQETQDVVSDGEGTAEFEVLPNRIKFDVNWDDLTSRPVMAHIHCAAAGVDGPVGVTLFAETKRIDGRAQGSFKAPDAGNSCGWATLGDVLGAMASGNTYVNVHTTNFPPGEIRGQIAID